MPRNRNKNVSSPSISIPNVSSSHRSSIALVMMVKNEEKRLLVTFDSVKKYIDTFIILDTGSTDSTIKLINDYTTKHNIKLFLKEQTFPKPFNFSKGRNCLLDFADEVGYTIDYFLLMDCNDELRHGDKLVEYINTYDGPATAFQVTQEWWTGTSHDRYLNIRLVKPKNEWRYKGRIHEWITNPKVDTNSNELGISHGFILYQDRTQDDDKTGKRFHTDKEVFEEEYKEAIEIYKNDKTKPPDTRLLFYYAQTLSCLQENEMSYKIYKERTEQDGFGEEKFHALLRCGEISVTLKHDWEESLIWFLKAFEISGQISHYPRVEPLYRIAEYYRDKSWCTCFMYLNQCCDLIYPMEATLFVNRRMYEYDRWHLMGICAFYSGQFEIGKIACLNAIKYEGFKQDGGEQDKKNLKFYEEELIKKQQQNLHPQNLKDNMANKIKMLKLNRRKIH